MNTYAQTHAKTEKKGASNLDTLPNVVMVEPSNAELVSVKKHARTTRNAKNKRRTQKDPIELSPDQQELVNIKNSLGLRHQDYAILLGIGLPRLSSYTYGRTASVPADVMKTARQLLAENAEATRLLKEKFNRPMSEILQEWENKLGTTSDAELAGLIGVVTMTINRWRKNETKPDLSALNRYDRIVNLVVNNIKQLVLR
ncbi:hypothetical protein [Oxalobacter formigenes]